MPRTLKTTPRGDGFRALENGNTNQVAGSVGLNTLTYGGWAQNLPNKCGMWPVSRNHNMQAAR